MKVPRNSIKCVRNRRCQKNYEKIIMLLFARMNGKKTDNPVTNN